ncbi:hypothetical protein BCR32DRAFT_283005 [Anaeromyces robustus]|uniref:Uncharacterized protein n=1 Tax=Anaeromyces robustus TaxID=1754192 RepID=A0A1Y1WW56_9FUNG|nr:hypothetical protein BCR32DRAFT_283005 [Anaeromyces robustus]|eukprot:ORX77635.1 hypothetical protein BCR32DRAFT_283005 [Anaeromyces robustus]
MDDNEIFENLIFNELLQIKTKYENIIDKEEYKYYVLKRNFSEDDKSESMNIKYKTLELQHNANDL